MSDKCSADTTLDARACEAKKGKTKKGKESRILKSDAMNRTFRAADALASRLPLVPLTQAETHLFGTEKEKRNNIAHKIVHVLKTKLSDEKRRKIIQIYLTAARSPLTPQEAIGIVLRSF